MVRYNDEIRDMLERIRNINESSSLVTNIKRGILNEIEEKEGDKKLNAIAITNDPKFGNNALQNQIDQFRSSVESGAQFTKPEDGKVSESPLIYMPSDGNLIFSGTIPCLNNLKWQMVLKTTTGNGCYIFVDGLTLNKENLQILNKLQGFYQNWREQWNAEAKDLETMVNNMREK